MLSRKAKYALIASIHLAEHYERGPRLIAEIAEAELLPKKFLEMILLELKNGGLLDSKKGKGGGYQLAKPPENVMVGTIVRIIDGPLAPMRCASVTAPKMCDDCKDPQTCGIRSIMKDARDAIAGVLDRVSLAEVIRRRESMKADKSDVNMFYI